MGANIAGIYGAQIFRQDDRPLYRRGFSVAVAVLCLGFVLALGRWLDDKWRQRTEQRLEARALSRLGDSNADDVVSKEEEEGASTRERRPRAVDSVQ